MDAIPNSTCGQGQVNGSANGIAVAGRRAVAGLDLEHKHTRRRAHGTSTLDP